MTAVRDGSGTSLGADCCSFDYLRGRSDAAGLGDAEFAVVVAAAAAAK